jgi:enamine deaminase RidA (YjgF/YER057c/UK114 family)
MNIADKLNSLGLTIPEVPRPVAAYVPALQAGDLVFTAGQLPLVNGELKFKGKLGADLTVAEGREAAKFCAVNCLAAVKGLIGDLEQVAQIVKVAGYVASAPGFTEQPQVLNGASELLVQVFGDAGRHARAAVGVAELPLGAAVEVEITVRLKTEQAPGTAAKC